MNFEHILQSLTPTERVVAAVAAAEDDLVLKAVSEAQRRGLITPILCGDKARIQKIADQVSFDLSSVEIIPTASSVEAARKAVELVREGEAQVLMKGLLQTADLLRAVLDKQNGLRATGVISHVSVLHSPILDRRLFLTDAAIVPYPDIKTKLSLIQNAVDVARGMGVSTPKVAVLAAVETVNVDMQATIDAAILTTMNRRGQISGCVVDGPLAMDLALSETAVAHKQVDSQVAGNADILLFHNIDSANSALKTFTHAGNCLFGGVVMGASAPIVLTSRSDSEQSKLFSIACAVASCRQQPRR